MESKTYTIDGKEFTLQHHGVKGMKWGKRKVRPQAVGRTPGGKQSATTNEARIKEARRKKVKRVAIIGAAVVGTVLGAYGAKKVSDVMKNKAFSKAHERGKQAIQKYMDGKFLKETRAVYKDKDALMKTLDSLDGEFRRLSMENDRYAKRASKNTIAAAKELLGKNYEIPLADLKRMGIAKY